MRGTVILTLCRHDGAGVESPSPLLIGEYDDVYKRSIDGRWRFAERRLTILFGSLKSTYSLAGQSRPACDATTSAKDTQSLSPCLRAIASSR